MVLSWLSMAFAAPPDADPWGQHADVRLFAGPQVDNRYARAVPLGARAGFRFTPGWAVHAELAYARLFGEADVKSGAVQPLAEGGEGSVVAFDKLGPAAALLGEWTPLAPGSGPAGVALHVQLGVAVGARWALAASYDEGLATLGDVVHLEADPARTLAIPLAGASFDARVLRRLVFGPELRIGWYRSSGSELDRYDDQPGSAPVSVVPVWLRFSIGVLIG